MSIKEEVLSFTTGDIKEFLKNLDHNIYEQAEEIRIRVDKPISIKVGNSLVSDFNIKQFYPSFKDIAQTMEIISGYSLYAFNEEIKKGFISVRGGHRIGISGKVILNEGNVVDIRHISSLNIRISREIKGCGESVLPFVLNNNQVLNTMIISPPGCGKTTLLRDLIRLISNKNIGITVIDERSEICSGKIDYGKNTDILDGCPKVVGMKMSLRSMAPKVIAVDEIGSKEDARAIWEMSCSGVSVLCTAHGENLEGLLKRGELNELIDKKLIDRFIFLENKDGLTGQIKTILDKNFLDVWNREV